MRSVAVCFAVALAGCGGAEQCVEHPSVHYNGGLARLLAAKGISSSVQKDRGVCFAKRDEAKVKAAARELERYFYQVADLLKDSCEEKAVVEWASRERLPFEVHDTRGAGGRPGRRMINIYSFSDEEVASNRRKLEIEAPRGATCNTKSSK